MAKTFDLEIRVSNLLFMPEIFVFVQSVFLPLCVVCMWARQRDRQVERERQAAVGETVRDSFQGGHCEPREKSQ